MNRTELARRLVEHRASDAGERAHVEAVLALLAEHDQPFHRASIQPGHVTASAFVLSPDASALLLVHHRSLERWLQPGGHVEPDDHDLEAAARREVAEEAGLVDLELIPASPWLLDVDVHVIPENPRRGEGAHRHFDLRLLFRAERWEVRAGAGVSDVRWVPLDAVETAGSDASVLRAVHKIRAWWGEGEPRHAPATARNRAPIEAILREEVPQGATVLEVGCGTGEHAAYLAPRLEVRTWQPTDADPSALSSARAWTASVEEVRLPRVLDASQVPWEGVPDASFDVVFSANVVHISPWETTVGLLEGSARALRPGGRVVLYGPYRVAGQHVAPSNDAFDADLRRRDPRWGVRDLEAVVAAAGRAGLSWRRTVPMPANNLVLVFDRDAAPEDPGLEALLRWWFGAEQPPSPAHQSRWWEKDEQVDRELAERFGELHQQAVAGLLDGWAQTPRGRLGLVLLLDQLSRHLYRGRPEMYAWDAIAQAWTLDGLRRGMDRHLSPHERQFLLMPLMHAEDRGLQALSVVAFRDLAASGEHADLAGAFEYAVRHREIVERFGHYPHRNAILGRATSPEEARFLEEPGSSF